MYRQMSEKSKPDKKCLWENGPGDASTQARNSKFCLKVLNEYMGKVSNSQKTSPSRFLYREERLPGGGANHPLPVTTTSNGVKPHIQDGLFRLTFAPSSVGLLWSPSVVVYMCRD